MQCAALVVDHPQVLRAWSSTLVFGVRVIGWLDEELK
jgi:hypothetical protein